MCSSFIAWWNISKTQQMEGCKGKRLDDKIGNALLALQSSKYHLCSWLARADQGSLKAMCQYRLAMGSIKVATQQLQLYSMNLE